VGRGRRRPNGGYDFGTQSIPLEADTRAGTSAGRSVPRSAVCFVAGRDSPEPSGGAGREGRPGVYPRGPTRISLHSPGIQTPGRKRGASRTGWDRNRQGAAVRRLWQDRTESSTFLSRSTSRAADRRLRGGYPNGAAAVGANAA